MPDPTSTCPILDRVRQGSNNPDEVKNALRLLEKTENFVAIGVAMGVIDEKSCFACTKPGGNTLVVNEAEWLNKFWFDGGNDEWWPQHGNKHKIMLEELTKALKLSAKHTSNTGQSCPIEAVWLCVEDEFESKARLLTQPDPAKARVVWVTRTPPPERECVAAPCP